MFRSHLDWGALGAAPGAAPGTPGVAPVDPAATASYARRPASNASTPVIGVVKVWVVCFVVRFLRIGFLLRLARAATFHDLPRLALASEGHPAGNHFGCARIQRLAKTTRPPSLPRSSLCQNCAKTLSVWCIGSCYLSESSFPKFLITSTSV